MKLDYQEIMDMPEPRNRVDVETIDSISGVYLQLVHKFTRLLEEARQIKVCWLQQERIDLYAKRLAANQREYQCLNKQRRQGEIANFCLRVREWVLSNPERRMKIRRLIGEARIKKWHAKNLAFKARLQLPSIPNTKRGQTTAPQADPYGLPPPDYNRKNTNRQEVGNWYRLPPICKQPNPHHPRRPHINKSHLGMRHLGMKNCTNKRGAVKQGWVLPTNGGMRRAIPSIVFWPAELTLDDEHRDVPQAKPEKKVLRRPTPIIVHEEWLQKNTETDTSQTGKHTAKEWPD